MTYVISRDDGDGNIEYCCVVNTSSIWWNESICSHTVFFHTQNQAEDYYTGSIHERNNFLYAVEYIRPEKEKDLNVPDWLL